MTAHIPRICPKCGAQEEPGKLRCAVFCERCFPEAFPRPGYPAGTENFERAFMSALAILLHKFPAERGKYGALTTEGTDHG